MKKPCIISEHLVRFYPDIPEKLGQHIKGCEECAEKIELIKLFAGEDYKELIGTEDCPDENTLAAFLDGALEEKERKEVEKHLLNCRLCFHLAAEFVRENHPATETVEELLQKVESPVSDIDRLLEKVREQSYDFIQKKYPALVDWFNDSFRSVREAILGGEQLIFTGAEGLGFSGQSSQSIPKIVFIIHELLKEISDEWDDKQIEKAIVKNCKRFKADRKLRAALIEYFIRQKNNLL